MNHLKIMLKKPSNCKTHRTMNMPKKQRIFCFDSPYEMEETIGFKYDIKENNKNESYSVDFLMTPTLHEILRIFDFSGDGIGNNTIDENGLYEQ